MSILPAIKSRIKKKINNDKDTKQVIPDLKNARLISDAIENKGDELAYEIAVRVQKFTKPSTKEERQSFNIIEKALETA